VSQGPRPLNAWKHGGYSNLGVLPTEDPSEFNEFHQALIEEWQPSGATEYDVVFDLAKCMWRKSRLDIYSQADATRKQAVDDAWRARNAINYEIALAQHGGGYRNPGFEAKLKKIKDMAAARTESEDLQRQLEHVTPEGLLQELKLDALLDAKIDRLIKRLLHLKAMKEMIRATEHSLVSNSVPRLTSSTRSPN